MEKLVSSDGSVKFGIFDEPVGAINYDDFLLKTPLGKKVGGLRKKLAFNQFVFIGVLGEAFSAGLAVVDLKFASNGFFYVHDRKNNSVTETKKTALPFSKTFIEPYPDKMRAGFSSGPLQISMDGSHVSAEGKGIFMDAEIDLSGASPLRICTHAGYRGWVYTQKTSPVDISGIIEVNGKKINISYPDHMALVDWTAGFMRRETFWNWAATACVLPDGRRFGLNLACGVNETGFTENAFWIDGTMVKVDTVHFDFNDNNLYDKWNIRSADGRISLEFVPENSRDEKLQAVIAASKFTQLMGVFNGSVKTDDGEEIILSNISGWTEDHYAKW